MPKNLYDIAREIAQDDDIKCELSKAAELVIELSEKQKNGSLSEIESSALVFLTILLKNS
jgi:hypothetical protein